MQDKNHDTSAGQNNIGQVVKGVAPVSRPRFRTKHFNFSKANTSNKSNKQEEISSSNLNSSVYIRGEKVLWTKNSTFIPNGRCDSPLFGKSSRAVSGPQNIEKKHHGKTQRAKNYFDNSYGNKKINATPKVSVQPICKKESFFKMHSELVDLYQLPAAVALEKGMCVTDGDEHAYTLRKIYTLVKFGIITNMTEVWYTRLQGICDMPANKVGAGDLQDFDDIIAQLTFDTNFYYRTMGDDLADRRGLDYFTLKLYQAMKKAGLLYEIICSNHGQEWVLLREKYRNTSPNESFVFQSIGIDDSCVHSLLDLEILIAKGLLDRNMLMQMFEDAYLPYLRPAACVIHGDAVVLFTHAPSGLHDLENAAQAYGIQDAMPQDGALAIHQYIKKMGEKYQEILQRGEGSKLSHPYCGKDDLLTPHDKLVWNRDILSLFRPEQKGNVAYTYVYGHHTTYDPLTDHVIELDNLLGKFPDSDLATYSKGRYRVIMAPEPYFAKNFNMMPEPTQHAELIKPQVLRPTTCLSFLDNVQGVSSNGSMIPMERIAFDHKIPESTQAGTNIFEQLQCAETLQVPVRSFSPSSFSIFTCLTSDNEESTESVEESTESVEDHDNNVSSRHN